MKKIEIQHTDLQIAPLNFGGNVFGWTLNEQQSFEILDQFVGAGFNFIDTADTYSWWVNGIGGQSEEIIGKWLKSRGNRQDMVIATKVGSETQEHGYDISKKHILKSADDSLRRLGVDHIDLYYTHFDDKLTPVEETLSAYDELIKAGKVRYIAASNLSPTRLIESFDAAEKNDLPKYVALQPHYNLVERSSFETDYAPLVEKYGLSVFPYWSLAAGFLTGKYRTEADFDNTTRGGGIKKYFDNKGKAVLKALDSIAEKHGVQQATVALAWLLAKPLITAPIVSATSATQLETLFAAPTLKLDTEDIQLLNEVSK
ncbi:aldo/keto reductase [Sphingobacterium sp. 2149]|uniref:aldo/keto reductase n=1 Tax=Sphingobacterium sp. 2149 TaxID=2817763 RepID=UPI001AE2B5EE|nr:aldo/keto reductase [Sphingobacterium sp. 2149]MDR6734645.1 aryl-alcohol dehydrogenase-like predicted oxidoreductase [Sphingobacterium sp. 2149]